MTSAHIIVGAEPFPGYAPEDLSQVRALCEEFGVSALDTAASYTASEEILGASGPSQQFTIHTKAPGWTPGSLSRDSILAGMEESLVRLCVRSVDIYYLHCPDPETSIEETLEAIQVLYKGGKFQRFGLSNFTPDQVRAIHAYQAQHSFVLPSVYQGNYNAISRHIEQSLFPVLLELGIQFFAYSPAAGGFLTKSFTNLEHMMTGAKGTEDTLRSDNNSRFTTHPAAAMYRKIYFRGTLLEGMREWGAIAEAEGVSRAALAYRWAAFGGALGTDRGDAIIVGARTVAQLRETLEALRQGPLSAAAVARIDGMWEMVQQEAPTDNYNKTGECLVF
ncbi:NADP-dependent oxidoreductase domain-containing protein [Aspergillus karnatakaensis]|uniref:aldo/keto reductase family protein n=1 Tax=Aspergillus karnatakaensis TaxID=1810916 RepID=UPI003CCDD0F7